MRNYKFSTFFVTAYLIIYTVLIHAGAPLNITALMFALSPFLVVWMAYTIVRYGTYNGRELEENEEWGYQDKSREEFNKL